MLIKRGGIEEMVMLRVSCVGIGLRSKRKINGECEGERGRRER